MNPLIKGLTGPNTVTAAGLAEALETVSKAGGPVAARISRLRVGKQTYGEVELATVLRANGAPAGLQIVHHPLTPPGYILGFSPTEELLLVVGPIHGA